jgi:hypothetical protein
MSQTHHSHVFEHQVRSASTPSVGHARSMPGEAPRPIGLSMLSAAAAAIGVAALVEVGTWLAAPDIGSGSPMAVVSSIIALVLVNVAILEFIFAYGVWGFRKWATRLGAGATIAAIGLTLLSAGQGSYAAHAMSLLLEIGTVWYLLSPRVQAAFRNHTGEGA